MRWYQLPKDIAESAAFANRPETAWPFNRNVQITWNFGRFSAGSFRAATRATPSKPVHIAGYTEKYFATGFSVTIALVDCSGCSWYSSDNEIPRRSAPSSRRIAS
jgi:hypothetical protein